LGIPWVSLGYPLGIPWVVVRWDYGVSSEALPGLDSNGLAAIQIKLLLPG